MKKFVQAAIIGVAMAFGPVWAQGVEGTNEQVEAPEKEAAGQQKAMKKQSLFEYGHHHIIRRNADSAQQQSEPDVKPQSNPLNDHRRLN